MAKKFGKLLRSLREGKASMGELARHLGVAVPYLSDVENGRRPALNSTRIQAAAAFLGLGPKEISRLDECAAKEKKFFEIPTEGLDSRSMQLGASLARGFNQLSEEQKEMMEQMFELGE